MTISGRSILLILSALVLPGSVQSQMGGGGIGAGTLGLRTQGQAMGIEPVPLDEAIPGRWRIEFRIRRHTEDPEAVGVWRTVTADMSMAGLMVRGMIRDDDFPGDFTCTIDEYGRCLDGRFRFHADDHDWQEFSFIVDREGYRAEGWAVYADPASGAVREYELALRKR